MRITDLQIRNAKPGGKPFKVADGGGLYLLVQPNGTRAWRMDYRFSIETFDLIGVDRTDKRGIPEVLLAQDGVYSGKAMLSLPAGQRDEFWKFVQTHATPRSTIKVPGKTATWLPSGIRARVKHLRGEKQLRHASFLGIEPPSAPD